MLKKLVIFFFLGSLVFLGSFAAGRRANENVVSSEVVPKITSSLFSPASFALTNRPFTIVISGMNNGAYVAKTLSSVFSQNYNNFRVIYIDDASDDGSFDLVQDLIFDSSCFGQVTLVQNEKRMGSLANLYRAVQTCSDDEIVVVMEGEDQLAHEWVLQRLNAYYANSDLWMTYGQYCRFPSYEVGSCRDYTEKKFRDDPFVASHLKTFYAGLFKKIDQADLISQGTFFSHSADLAYMIPMLEMGRDHYYYIPEILYISVGKKEKNLEELVRSEKIIRMNDSYLPLIKKGAMFSTCGE